MLDCNIQFLKGVGPQNAKKLSRLDIHTIEDLIYCFPVKYEDRRNVRTVGELSGDEKMLLKIKIYDKPQKIRIKKTMTAVKVIGKDETGFVSLTFFNQDFLADKLNSGQLYYVYGKVKADYGKYEMVNPEIEAVDNNYKAGRIMPLYGLTKGLSNNEMTKLVKLALDKYIDEIDDIIPEHIRAERFLISRKRAIAYMHFPPDSKRYSAAKRTIAFERLLVMQIGLMSIKNRLKSNSAGIQMECDVLESKLLNTLPYKLTNAQMKAANEIKCDMSVSKPMNRLVQGDVGSGKTIVAVIAMLRAVSSGYQASMMAPTEILAMQHYETITEYMHKACIDIKIEFLSGSTKKKKKAEILNELKAGNIDILIGTHALIEDNVEFCNIGLVVTDEQHRFGVRQRALLSNKGKNPDILVMTATPIPRTLALMVYGDLDISVIDEMPPGRQTIITNILSGDNKEQVYSFIKENVDKGRQAYIVAPLIEDSEELELDSAQKIYEELRSDFFAQYKLGLLHGKMKSVEKDEIMKKFYTGEINILVSTTVIEVGVNVPNAVIMVVLNSERFGLAQLHQLRGRVGRGNHQSYCILVNESKSQKSKERMNILKNTDNGFIIAEEDLKIRGPGDFFGTMQHGLSKYEMQNIISDVNVVHDVQILSKKLMIENPYLEGIEYTNLKKKIQKLFSDENIVFN